MGARELKKNVYSVGAVDWDRRLFDELIPLPDGTSYNSYIVKGSKKTALMDTVDPAKTDILLENLKALGVGHIDYIIAHHAEQDHSGSIPQVMKKYPTAKVVTNPKCKSFLIDHLLLSEDDFIEVADGETLSLGDKTLQFIYAPWVHWPETMLTYIEEDKILFTCDLFGSHLASSDLFVKDEAKVYEAAKRYYAEIMMPFRNNIKKHIEVISKLKFDIIATSHGPIYDNPKFIISAYKEWISDDVKNEVIIPYVSMHGSTEKMVQYLTDVLAKKGIEVKQFHLSKTDIGEVAKALVDAATIVIGAPTALIGPHPQAAYVTMLANALRPKTRFLSIIGSFGWGSKAVDQLKTMIPNLKVELIEPVIVKGYPKEVDFKALDKLAESITEKHKTI